MLIGLKKMLIRIKQHNIVNLRFRAMIKDLVIQCKGEEGFKSSHLHPKQLLP
jgi:hypothetical protein